MPDSFSNSNWVWGGSAQIGMTYYFDPTFFLDANYTYGMTARFTASDVAPFSNTITSGDSVYTDSGTLYVSNSQRVIVQTIGISINKLFS